MNTGKSDQNNYSVGFRKSVFIGESKSLSRYCSTYLDRLTLLSEANSSE